MHFYNGEVENVLHCFKIHLFRSGQTMATVPATVLNALYNETSRDIQEWLAELTMSTEPECIYVLYAKSFLDESEQQQHSSDHCENQTEEIHFDRTSQLPPEKPKRCIARMMSSSSRNIMTASTPVSMTIPKKYRTTISYQLDNTKKNNPAPISSVSIRVKSRNDSDDENMYTSDKMMESECDSVPNETSTDLFDTSNVFDTSMVPIIPVHSGKTNLHLTNRSISSKISTKEHGYKCKLRRGSQILYRSQLQQQQKQKENEVARKPNDENNGTITNKTVIQADLHSYSFAKSSLKVDEQWIAKPDDQSMFVVNDQNLTWPRSQPNHAKQSSGDFMKINSDLNNYKTIYEKQFDCFRNHDSNESENYSSIFATEENDSQSSKTMISAQGFDSVDDCNQDQLLSSSFFGIPRKITSHGQVLLNTPTSLQVIKSISNISRYSGNAGNDVNYELTSTGVTATCESAASSTNSSVDSGQGSTELSFQNCSSKDPINCGKAFAENNLPTYARVANTIDHVLRVCSTLHAALNDENSGKFTGNLICEAKVLITSIQCSPCFTFLSADDVETVCRMIFALESEEHCSERLAASDFLTVLLRKIIHEILIIFATIISSYLAECTNQDRLLVIALEHLIHLMLFGDEICHLIIQHGGLDSLLYFCEVPSITNGTLRLLLRSLAILCSNYQGALKLLTAIFGFLRKLNKFDLIIQLLLTSSIACSAEAAGILTQLTNPEQNYVRLGNMMPRIVIRILEIIDKSKLAESLLLALAALANITVQEIGTIDILYEHNAIKRIVQAYKRPKCHNVFIQEQLLTVFISLANGAYIEALISQGAIDLLLSLLATNNPAYANYCIRTQIRATQCLRTIAKHGIGLKAIHEMNGYPMILEVIQDNNAPVAAKSNLWWIVEQLEKKYHPESAV
uniref:Protein inscuteable homologue C-terminal domain-containing protein n=1 Tax=Onchocerca volvulus TaxID=6282 RepID=A0A8R1TK83_ONCVO